MTRKEFVRAVAGMHHQADPRLLGLYRRAVVCQRFPAYKLEELRELPATEITQALELLSLAEQVRGA